MRIYCEHNALHPKIRRLARNAGVEIVHFPYDSDSRPRRHISKIACPSAARIEDLHLPIRDLPGTIDDYSGSRYFKEILALVGYGKVRDALHVDSAFKSGCSAFIAADHDVLDHGVQLESLLGMKFLHPVAGFGDLEALISCGPGKFRPRGPGKGANR